MFDSPKGFIEKYLPRKTNTLTLLSKSHTQIYLTNWFPKGLPKNFPGVTDIWIFSLNYMHKSISLFHSPKGLSKKPPSGHTPSDLFF